MTVTRTTLLSITVIPNIVPLPIHPSIYDVMDDMLLDAEAFGDLVIFLEVYKKKLFYRKTIQTTQVTALSIPNADTSTLPRVSIRFNAFSLAPEQLVLESEFSLPVLNWLAIDRTMPNQWPSIDSAYGIPFGAYKLEIGLPELSDTKKHSAEIIVSIDADPIVNTEMLRSGKFLWEYSRYSYSIEWIDPAAYRVFEMVKVQIENRASKKIQESIKEEFKNRNETDGITQTTSTKEDLIDEEVFQVSRNMDSYRYVYFVENSIRKYLWEKLQSIYNSTAKSSKWWLGCFPEEIRNHIREKMSTRNPILDKIKVESTPLHYCSFNELGQIIEKEWQKLFKDKPLDRSPFFGHLSYLENIRNAIAHNRPIGSKEVHILLENGKSILAMLGISVPRTR